MRNLLPETPATLLPPVEGADQALNEAVQAGTEEAYASVAARFPAYSGGWAGLAALALDAKQPVTAYAYARTGYHRGLDALRRNGWKGHGPVPWEHEPNRGFLRSLALLALAARAIGETAEWDRCSTFLRDSSPAVADELLA